QERYGRVAERRGSQTLTVRLGHSRNPARVARGGERLGSKRCLSQTLTLPTPTLPISPGCTTTSSAGRTTSRSTARPWTGWPTSSRRRCRRRAPPGGSSSARYDTPPRRASTSSWTWAAACPRRATCTRWSRTPGSSTSTTTRWWPSTGGVLLVSVLHFVPDSVNPHAVLACLRGALAPGSHLAIAHATSSGDAPAGGTGRGPEEIQAFFGDFVMVEPGLVQAHEWRPDRPRLVGGTRLPLLAGMAWKP